MSNIDYLIEWNLTPNGWVKNDKKSRTSQKDKSDGVPSDRVKTIQEWEYERSNWSGMTGNTSVTYESQDEALLKQLTEKYGKYPEDYLKYFTQIDLSNEIFKIISSSTIISSDLKSKSYRDFNLLRSLQQKLDVFVSTINKRIDEAGADYESQERDILDEAINNISTLDEIGINNLAEKIMKK